MEPSPLTQQARPEVFQQKVVSLYEELFKVKTAYPVIPQTFNNNLQDEEEHEKSEGYWREFFLLKPDKAALTQLIHNLSPDDLLHLQVRGWAITNDIMALIWDIGSDKAIVFSGSGIHQTRNCSYRCSCTWCKSGLKISLDLRRGWESRPSLLSSLQCFQRNTRIRVPIL